MNVLSILRFAKAQQLLATVPDVPTIRQEKRIPTAWTLQEVTALLNASNSLQGYMRDLPISRAWWYTSLLLFLYVSGLRIKSALTLQTQDVWLDRSTARIRAASDKTWTDQIVILSPDLVRLLRQGMTRRELVWVYPWNSRKLWLDLKEILTMAGLPHGREFAFHRIRRTHATQAVIVAGWEAARRSLGHTTERMTRVYVDQSQVSAVGSFELPQPKLTG